MTSSQRERITPTELLVLAAIISLICAQAASAACGCTSMTLKYRNAVGGAHSTNYCVASAANFSECNVVLPNTCGVGKKTVNCPIGGSYGNDGQPWIGVGFEVVASLPAGTNLAECTYGQGIQRNITEDGHLNANAPTGHAAPIGIVTYGGGAGVNARLYSSSVTPMPNLGATDAQGRLKLASDAYTMLSPMQTIAYANDQLRWSDFPAVYVNGDTAKKVVVTDRFIAFIRNSANGTVYCACKFLVQGDKNAGGDILNTAAFTQETSHNCVFSPQ
jgi:hypothetical protein